MNVSFKGIYNLGASDGVNQKGGTPMRSRVAFQYLNDNKGIQAPMLSELLDTYKDSLKDNFIRLDIKNVEKIQEKNKKYILNGKRLALTKENIPVFEVLSKVYQQILDLNCKVDLKNDYYMSGKPEYNFFMHFYDKSKRMFSYLDLSAIHSSQNIKNILINHINEIEKDLKHLKG